MVAEDCKTNGKHCDKLQYIKYLKSHLPLPSYFHHLEANRPIGPLSTAEPALISDGDQFQELRKCFEASKRLRPYGAGANMTRLRVGWL